MDKNDEGTDVMNLMIFLISRLDRTMGINMVDPQSPENLTTNKKLNKFHFM